MHSRQRKSGTALSVSVVICTRNRPRSLRGCLLAVLQQSVLPDEIVVVDNAAHGEAGVHAGVKGIYSARVIRETRPGIAGARNRGLESARGAIVSYLDDDCRPKSDWLETVVSRFDADPGVGCVTGPVRPVEVVFRAQRLIEERGGFSRGEQPAEFRREIPLTVQAWRFGTGGNMSFRRDAIREAGGFDSAMRVGEDIDALYRVVRGGWALRYEPQAQVFHRHVAATRDLHRRLYRWGWGYAAFLTKTGLNDPPMRRKVVREFLGVCRYHAGARFWPALCGRSRFPAALVALEIAGLLAGVPGYALSRAGQIFRPGEPDARPP